MNLDTIRRSNIFRFHIYHPFENLVFCSQLLRASVMDHPTHPPTPPGTCYGSQNEVGTCRLIDADRCGSETPELPESIPHGCYGEGSVVKNIPSYLTYTRGVDTTGT